MMNSLSRTIEIRHFESINEHHTVLALSVDVFEERNNEESIPLRRYITSSSKCCLIPDETMTQFLQYTNSDGIMESGWEMERIAKKVWRQYI